MLHLRLRSEFQGRRLKGTAIELANGSETGATQIDAKEFLDITYPSADALTSIETVGSAQGRPLVLIGERGQGKSHLMAMLYHSFTDAEATRNWLSTWASRLGNTRLAELPLRSGMRVISESLHRQSYKFLWDLVFERHPYGPEVRGMWKGQGEKQTEVPSYDLLMELFTHTPTALILDEFQTWYDGLTNTKRRPWRNWTFNFVQLLSEIAKEHPERLVLVVSVRNGNTDAFQQIQRVGPILADFKGPTAKQDRQKLLIHRLFENRMQVSKAEIGPLIDPHVSEYLRLLGIPPSEHDQVRREFVQCWPFSPHLMQLLEDQVLVATQAQETRDLIRVLADLFKYQEDSPVVTAADFRLDNERSGIAALLDSVSNQHHSNLREKAQRNLSSVQNAVNSPDSVVPHLSEIVGALWLRSLSVGNLAGAEPATLQVDITRAKPIDDNAFEVELSTIVENSFNIHEDGPRLIFREEENPQAKLIASARNDKLFADGADIDQLAREVRYVIGGQEDVSTAFRVVVLPENWSSAPWDSLVEIDQPQNWDERLPLLVLPVSPDEVGPTLGPWLRDHLQGRRNAIRFLLPQAGSTSIYRDRDLLVLSRAVVLAERWKTQSREFRQLLAKYQRDLRDILTRRFDRFAVVDSWNYPEPVRCTFHVESHKALGARIPAAIDEHIRTNLFIPEDFDALVGVAADNNESIGKLLRELREPRPGGEPCIPWLGETSTKEHVIRLCARGKIAINVRGMEYLQVGADESEETAWMRMRGKLGTGKHLEETSVLRPQAVPHTKIVSEPSPDPPLTPPPGNDGDKQDNGDSPAAGTAAGHVVPGGIFGGDTALVPHASDATSALNLLGKVESWGINTGTQVHDMALSTSSLTGAQLDKLLRALPDGVTYALRLKKAKK